MWSIREILLFFALIASVAAAQKAAQNTTKPRIVAGYEDGVSGMPSINETNCMNQELLNDDRLSNALECARTCKTGEEPKTCYYSFVIERYPVNGHACQFCTPNVTNSICANCQCVPANGVERMALTVNRMLPGPSIQVCLGDYIVVDVRNTLKEDAVTIHWHGLYQEGTQYYDGVPNLTQCPINFQNTFRYQFFANNGGTHFWHAHTGLHKMDGVFGSLIVRQPEEQEPNAKLYDFDLANHVIVINDWMDEEGTERFPGRRTGVVGQLPDSVLINGKGNYTDSDNVTNGDTMEVIKVQHNQRYRMRLVNSFCTVCGAEFSIQGHSMTVIETDGQPIEPVVVNSIVSFSGERYDFVISTNRTPRVYWMQLRGLNDCEELKVQQLAKLQYLNGPETPFTNPPTYDHPLSIGVILNPTEGDCNNTSPNAVCVDALRNALTVDEDIMKEKADVQIFLSINIRDYEMDDIFRPNTYQTFSVPISNITAVESVGEISFEFPPSPPLSQASYLPKDQFCNADNLPTDCTENCVCSNMYKIPLNSIVEIGLADEFIVPLMQHPFHLHGNSFYVLSMGQPLGPVTNATGIMTVDYLKQLDEEGKIKRNFLSPPAKDTLTVPNNGYTIFRFRADNPGYWLFHCHIVYHQMVGMELIFNVGKKIHLPPVPAGFPKCGNFKPKIKKRPKKKN